MKIDLTYLLTKEQLNNLIKIVNDSTISKLGHFGTHFDIQDKEFPLEYCERKGIIFDVSQVKDRDITVSDLNMECIIENSFVLIRTGVIDRVEYGSIEYFKEHPQLSQELIEALVSKHVSLIGIDMAGVRRGAEHAVADQFCADHGTYIIENLVNMKEVYSNLNRPFIVHTYPLNLRGYTGIPCRVIVEFEE